MAEDNDNATEKPTDKKVSEAHDKGQFAQAPEVQIVFGLIAAYFVFLFSLDRQSRYMTEMVASILGNLEKYQIISDFIPHWTGVAFLTLFGLLAPMFLATTIASILAGAPNPLQGHPRGRRVQI
jgi:flagellar biosynthetic protein FlhB